MSYIFGPVSSRRLGRSLGIDLVPFKTCSLNCVYCECGATTHTTLERKEYVPTQDVLDEFYAWHARDGKTDVVTFSGSGEPTLHSGLGTITKAIKQKIHVPVCLLTNATLLFREDVRHDAALADIVVPSLDAADEEMFHTLNRPDPSLSFNTYIEGLRTFLNDYTGRVWLEIFLVPGMNDSLAYVTQIAQLARSLPVEKIQLNTAVRTPTEHNVRPCTKEHLQACAALFTPYAEIIASFPHVPTPTETLPDASDIPARICDILMRRPCSIDDLASGLHLRRVEVEHALEIVAHTHPLAHEEREGQTVYFIRI